MDGSQARADLDMQITVVARQPASRSVLRKPMLSTHAEVAGAQTRPPIPVPAETMPMANAQYLSDHVGATVIDGIKERSVAMPSRSPWTSWKCRSVFPKLARTLAMPKSTPPAQTTAKVLCPCHDKGRDDGHQRGRKRPDEVDGRGRGAGEGGSLAWGHSLVVLLIDAEVEEGAAGCKVHHKGGEDDGCVPPSLGIRGSYSSRSVYVAYHFECWSLAVSSPGPGSVALIASISRCFQFVVAQEWDRQAVSQQPREASDLILNRKIDQRKFDLRTADDMLLVPSWLGTPKSRL